MRRHRRFVDVAVWAPLGAVATLVATVARRRHPDAVEEPTRVAPPPVPVEPPPSTPAPHVEQLPIDGYDHLAASQVVDRLTALTPDELALVADYERAKRHRQSVLAKIAQLQP